ncbi:MAG: YitT family protein [Eubacteriales bacterium]|nr:YitT family protein [Eubacteriales bacterium]
MLNTLRRKNKFYEYALIFIGSFMIGYAIKNIYDPINLVTGGVSGFAVIFNALFSIPLWLSNTLLNIPLFVVTYFVKGWKFMMRTLFSTVVLSVALLVIPEHALIEDGDMLLSALFGGLITGVGTGLVFMNKATTGGTDMLAAVIQHFMRHRTVAQILMVLDGLVVLLGAGIFGINTALYAVIAVYLVTKVSDGLIDGLKFAKTVYIVSDRSEEIAQTIMQELSRGATALKARGMYTGTDKEVLFCVVAHREIPVVEDIIAQIDENAFVIIADANEVMGEGFLSRGD